MAERACTGSELVGENFTEKMAEDGGLGSGEPLEVLGAADLVEGRHEGGADMLGLVWNAGYAPASFAPFHLILSTFRLF
jgi:hypothetical protein